MNKILLFMVVLCCLINPVWSQTGFDVSAYHNYLAAHANMSHQSLMEEYADQNTYYRGLGKEQPVAAVTFYDSVVGQYQLTPDELALLSDNHFVVTERLSFDTIGEALHNIYGKDLPVFLSTDAVLYAFHASYDRILMDLEIRMLQGDLEQILLNMYNGVPALVQAHSSEPLRDALADVDLYVTMALSLFRSEKIATQTGYVDNFDAVWTAIQNEQEIEIPLFSERDRRIDFSQFKPRGHYTKTYNDHGEIKTLEPYFQAMMWLGRIDFWLTPPPENPWEIPWTWQEIQRMARATLLMNELLNLSGARSHMQNMDKVITFMVGESDNLTPDQLAAIIDEQNITLESIADSTGLADFQALLTASDEYQQKILSALIVVDPFTNEPGVLPISFKLFGQRFVIDSYVLDSVVYDRIIYNDQKIMRMMPDPLDAMFVLGNNNALPLLQEELSTWHYTQNLAGLRYLVDSYDQPFWEQSLYNAWLNAIRAINPIPDVSEYPWFMQSAAWQHKQLNTQLASWAQLRHDNLLYAKQSYTSSTLCSYPHSYIEPYPQVYHALSSWAQRSEAFFNDFELDNYLNYSLGNYHYWLQTTAAKLETLAVKELHNEAFSEQDTTFLRRMLFIDGGSGEPPFSGWYSRLFYDREDPALEDHVIADVHTQPTDQAGNIVGRVLHVGVGRFNLGFFVAPSPSNDFQPMLFTGPVMSYYEKITNDFERLSDEEWKTMVFDDQVPARPDWVNIYLADADGNRLPAGRELPYQIITDIQGNSGPVPQVFALSCNYPNPFNPVTTIDYGLPVAGVVELSVFDITGRRVAVLVNNYRNAGTHRAVWDASNMASGVYFYRLRAGSQQIIRKMTLIK